MNKYNEVNRILVLEDNLSMLDKLKRKVLTSNVSNDRWRKDGVKPDGGVWGKIGFVLSRMGITSIIFGGILSLLKDTSYSMGPNSPEVPIFKNLSLGKIAGIAGILALINELFIKLRKDKFSSMKETAAELPLEELAKRHPVYVMSVILYKYNKQYRLYKMGKEVDDNKKAKFFVSTLIPKITKDIEICKNAAHKRYASLYAQELYGLKKHTAELNQLIT
jgi:hypothetical protein